MTLLLLRPGAVLERNVMAYRRMWLVFLSGFAEPVLYLLSMGIGVGALVGSLEVAGAGEIDYRQFVAPALVATSAMNGSAFDATYGFFFKLKWAGTFDAMLATPLGPLDVAAGELIWCVTRGSAYAVTFLGVAWAFGLVVSPWALLGIPVVVLIGVAFAGAGMAASTWMRSFVDFDKISLVLIPLFLFSATFFPLERYPEALQWVVRLTPLYQGVHLLRSLSLGIVGPGLLVHVAYLLAMGIGGIWVASHRMGRLLQP